MCNATPRFLNWLRTHGLTLERIFIERGVSGSKPQSDRPEGAALLAIHRPDDTIITPS